METNYVQSKDEDLKASVSAEIEKTRTASEQRDHLTPIHDNWKRDGRISVEGTNNTAQKVGNLRELTFDFQKLKPSSDVVRTEEAYKRKIRELRLENKRLLMNYNAMYRENQSIKEKLEMNVAVDREETHRRVSLDHRQTLREAGPAYRERIAQLEETSRHMQETNDTLTVDNRDLKLKIKNLTKTLTQQKQKAEEIVHLEEDYKKLKMEGQEIARESQKLMKLKLILQRDISILKPRVSELYRTIGGLESDLEYQLLLNRR